MSISVSMSQFLVFLKKHFGSSSPILNTHLQMHGQLDLHIKTSFGLMDFKMEIPIWKRII